MTFTVLCCVLFPVVAFLIVSVVVLFIVPNCNDDKIICVSLLSICRESTIQATGFLLYMCFVQPSSTTNWHLERFSTCAWVRWMLMCICAFVIVLSNILNMNHVSETCVNLTPDICFAVYCWSLINSWYVSCLLLGIACSQGLIKDNILIELTENNEELLNTIR